jgi:hypothetical protein
MDLYTAIHLLEQEVFSMNESQKIRVLCTILYPNESFASLTQTQLDKVRNILNDFK